MRVPAVVGSWPEPFLQASAGADRLPVQVDCAGDRDPCDEAARRLAEAGADASIERLGERERAEPAMRLLVGPWGQLQTDPAAAQLADGPAGSGVFAEFERRGGDWRLFGLDDRDRVAARLGSGAGLSPPCAWVRIAADLGRHRRRPRPASMRRPTLLDEPSARAIATRSRDPTTSRCAFRSRARRAGG